MKSAIFSILGVGALIIFVTLGYAMVHHIDAPRNFSGILNMGMAFIAVGFFGFAITFKRKQ
jgi:hypothetical protein